jgi:quinol monooxygenase YgiN
MIHVQVNYRIRSDRMEEAEREIAAFIATLQINRPRFATYYLFRPAADAASRIHLISFRDDEVHLEHTQSAHVKRFVENMLPLCEVGPVYTELKEMFTRISTAH